MSILNIKETILSLMNYWNGDCNEMAMKDALHHYENELDDVIDALDDIEFSNVLDNAWRYCDEYGLPECINEFGGSGFSAKVLVTDGKGNNWMDHVIYPHGLYGADRTPRFCSKNANDIVAWMYIPRLQPKGK